MFADVDFKMNYMHWIIIYSPRAAWHVFHAEHQQPWGSDEEEEAAEAGEEAAAVQEQGLLLCVLSLLLLSLSSLLFLMFYTVPKYWFVQDGAPDTGGTLKIYGEALRKEVGLWNNIAYIKIIIIFIGTATKT